MDKGIHFISGLPRSGSTLLSALLRQNPRFTADVNSPVFHLFNTLQIAMSGRTEFHGFFDEPKRLNVLRGAFDSYYNGVHQKQLVFDTNRAWCMKLAAIDRLFPDAKVICCVRPLAQILDSIERVVRDNPLETSRLFNFEGFTNVYGRSDILNAVPAGLIGSAYAGLKEAFHGPFAGKLLLVTYESLTKNPCETMEHIADFVGEKPFVYDFENVAFDTPDYDAGLGLRGLHHVARGVRATERESLLPPDLVKRFETSAFWLDAALNKRGVRVI